MKYTQLGRSGLEISRICLGCMTYGTPKWRPWVLDEVDARPFYKKALDLGINFFDTADMYSMGVSEEVTGRALAPVIRDTASETSLPMSRFQPPSHCAIGCSAILSIRAASAGRLLRHASA